MKLHKLCFCNLNSLQGTWEIDFASETLVSEGIFLITGPTGSGKSTILDAICLALYGRTPRLDRITKSSNEIISRGCTECFAQLEFSTSDDKLYKVLWRQRRAHNSPKGKLQEPERELSLESKILATKIKEVEEQIPKISGLEYQQFLRSILLAQGDFATLMEATTNERAKILEKITGTAMYRELSALCFQRCKEMRKDLQEEQQKLPEPLAEEERRELEEQIQTAQKQLQQIDNQQSELGKVEQHYKKLEQLQQEQQKQNISELPDHSQDRQLLALDRQAQELAPLYQKCQEDQQKLVAKQKIAERQSTEQTQLTERLEGLKTELATAEKKYRSSQELQQSFAKQREKLKKLEWDSSNNALLLSQQQEQFEQDCKKLTEAQDLVQQLQEQRQTQNKSMAQLQNDLNKGPLQSATIENLHYQARQLKELQIPAQTWRKQFQKLGPKTKPDKERDYPAELAAEKETLDQLKNSKLQVPELELQPLPEILQITAPEQREDALELALDCCQRLISPLERYLLEYEQYSQSLRESQETAAEAQQQEEQLAKVELDLERQEEKLKQQDRYCKTLRENSELHQHLLLFEYERKKLQHGEICPLCGATEHNLPQAPTAPKEGQATQKELEKQERLLQELQNAVQGDRDEVKELRNHLKSAKQQVEKQSSQAVHLQNEVSEQSRILQAILSRQTGFAPQALLPQLWQALQSEPKEDLRAELSDAQKQLKLFQEAENQAFEEQQKLGEQLQAERREQIQEHEERSSELQKQQFQARELEDFCHKLREDFVRVLSPYEQYLKKLDEIRPKKQEEQEEQKEQKEQELLQSIAQAASADPEVLLQIAESEALQASLQKSISSLEQALDKRQALQEQQNQLPLQEERRKAAEQKRQDLQAQVDQSKQQIEQNEAEAAKLRLLWQEQTAELLTSEEAATGSALNTEQIEQSIEQQLQHTEQIKESIQAQSTELKVQVAGICQVLANCQKECEDLQQTHAKALQNWQKALADSPFPDAESFRAAKMEAAARQNLERQIRHTEQELYQKQKRIQELEQQIIECLSLKRDFDLGPEIREAAHYLKENYAKIAALQWKAKLDHIQILIAELSTQNKAQGSEIREYLGGRKQHLADDKSLCQKLDENLKLLQQKQGQLEDWELLDELIGSADGNKYNNFAQQLSFEQLLHHANFYLERVSDRYLLESLPEQPLEFFVCDLYQGQNLRPSSNLSGGEKFLISLSLALALSKISANNVPVQSLFLDEGFGTLDEEALHNTLEVLASLSNDGKLIGLISHISILQERIMCQIQLESNNKGRSLIHSSSGIVKQISRKKEPSPQKVSSTTQAELF